MYGMFRNTGVGVIIWLGAMIATPVAPGAPEGGARRY